jgi:hypothetical protein
MEINGQEQQVTSLLKYSQSTLPVIKDNSISIYSGEFDLSQAAIECKKLHTAFPSLPAGFFDILIDRMKDNGFSAQRTSDAIKNCIDTCEYPTPTIANIISWDKKIKVYSHSQVIKEVNNGASFDQFVSTDFGFNDYPIYVSKIEFDRYKLKKFIPKQKV